LECSAFLTVPDSDTRIHTLQTSPAMVVPAQQIDRHLLYYLWAGKKHNRLSYFFERPQNLMEKRK
jgi:hypothetical protein